MVPLCRAKSTPPQKSFDFGFEASRQCSRSWGPLSVILSSLASEQVQCLVGQKCWTSRWTPRHHLVCFEDQVVPGWNLDLCAYKPYTPDHWAFLALKSQVFNWLFCLFWGVRESFLQYLGTPEFTPCDSQLAGPESLCSRPCNMALLCPEVPGHKSMPRSSTLGGTMWYGKLNWVLKHAQHGPLNLVLFPSTIFAVLMLVILGNDIALKTKQKELERIEVKGTFICLTLVWLLTSYKLLRTVWGHSWAPNQD